MGAVPLVTPEAREAHCGAQFPGLGILLARDGECASAVQGRYHRDKISLSQPANSGLLAENQEIPVSGKISPHRAHHAVSRKQRFPGSLRIAPNWRQVRAGA